MSHPIVVNLTRNEMKQIFGGFDNPCHPITCCFPPNSPDCIAGPCTGSRGCVDICQCNGIIQ